MLVAGCGGSGGSDGAGTTAASATAQNKEAGPTQAALEPVDGNSATGTASFLVRPHSTPLLQITAEGLEPVSGESRYAIWIVGNRHDMVNLAAFQVGENARLSRRIDNTESHVFVEEGSKTELLITKVENIYEIGEGISESSNPWDPPLIGKSVLRGNFEGALVGSTAQG